MSEQQSQGTKRTLKSRIRRFEHKHGEPLIVSAITAFFIATAILQFDVNRFEAFLALALIIYTFLVFAFTGLVWKVLGR